MKILVTGATGNVGKALLNRLDSARAEPYAGVCDGDRAKQVLGEAHRFCTVGFKRARYPKITVDAIFLMRPPQLTDPRPFENFS